ncbi:putative extracellular region, partial [Operophtera brumata]
NDLHFYDGSSIADVIAGDIFFEIIDPPELQECSFVFKAHKAQQAGARAIIITEMELDVNIPAGFLLGRSGYNILRTLRLLTKSYAVVNLPVNMTHVQMKEMKQPPWIAW